MNKRRRILYFKNIILILLSFFCGFSFLFNLKGHTSISITRFLNDHNISVNVITKVFSDLFISVNKNIIIYLIICVFIFLLIKFYFENIRLTKKEIIVISLLSVMFSVFCYLFDILNKELITNYIILRFWIKILGLSLILYCSISIIYKNIDKFVYKNFDNKKVIENKKKIIIGSFLFILACWIPYIISHYPAMFMGDTVDQLRQIIGLTNKTLLYVSDPINPNVVINDSNPVFLTFIISIFVKMGQLLGNINYGFFLYVVIQVFMSISLFSYSIYFGVKKGINKYLCILGLLFYSLFPMFPMYAVTIVKNMIFGIFYFIYLFMFYEIIYNSEKSLGNKVFLIKFVICQLLMMLFIKHGIYIVLLSGIVLIINKKQYWKKLAISLFVPLFIFQVLFTNLLLPYLGISKGKSAEMYSIPFQQTGLYVKKHENEITKDEKEAINSSLYYNRIKEKYNPILSDGMKDASFRQNCSSEDLIAYFKIWFKMFFKHPLTYFQATYMNNAGYFNPKYKPKLYYKENNMDRATTYMCAGKVFWGNNHKINYEYSVKGSDKKYVTDSVTKIKIDRSNRNIFYIDKKTKKIIELEPSNKIWLQFENPFKHVRSILYKITSKLQGITIIKYFFGLGTYAWICILIIVFGILKKKKDLILFMVPTIASYLIMIAGPYAGFRYAYPIVQSIFLLIVVAIKELNNNEELRKIKE
ncbi:DUF6020 family protein [Anaerofustis stercorihominis]|uniref:DUF6020 family protein n=1 Tax=Anaerofustis stercorihominis TaxID=214853 RepID=UPI00214B21F8|nr:DUF6020 family protein [Anaerofustis stercorihominis]MCR2033573.1 DUF6020 family protein [Anaerofustis stercorihominis]